MAKAVDAGRAVVAAWNDVELSREEVARVADAPVGDGGSLHARQSQTFVAASASAELVRRHADLVLQAQEKWQEVAHAQQVLHGRERLVERRTELLRQEEAVREQKVLDEVSLHKSHREQS